MGTTWVKRWKYEISPEPSRPGVWRMKGGGYLIRARANEFRTGRQKEVMRTVHNTDAAGAYRQLQDALDEIKNGRGRAAAARIRFGEYAASLFERKVDKGELGSAQTVENWELMLRLHLLPAFGDMFVDAISRADIETWLAEEARKVKAKGGSPITVNGWLRIFKVIMNEAVDELGLDKNPIMKVKGIDTSNHVTFTEEEPNALTPEEVPLFLAAMRERHPQHLAMVALGFATGWRPSMMRPLRRQGATPDIVWDRNVVLARRSHTRGVEVKEVTKNGTRFHLTLPPDLMNILRWHSDELPLGKMRDSELLFPSEAGGFRSQTLLGKPFEDVCKHLKLGKRVTPKGMRRTFQDLARQVGVAGLVQRSICGHLTEEMTERYSSVGQTEVEAALAKVISFAGYAQLNGSVHRGGKVVGNDILNAREPGEAAL